MTFKEKLRKLVSDLLAGTNKGTIKWTETADEQAFRAVLHTGLVRVQRIYAEAFQGNPSYPIEGFEYALVALDEQNKELARYVAKDQAEAKDLRELWQRASNSARNAEQKIDSLLKELEGMVR